VIKIERKKKQKESDLKSRLRAIHESKCSQCKKNLYNLNQNIPIRRWSQSCWKCGKETEVVSYIIKGGGIGNSVIGSHKKLDEILKSEYPFVKDVYSKTMQEWTIGNLCQHCGSFQGNGFIEHNIVWDAALYSYDNSFDIHFPIERVLSNGRIVFKDGNEENKDIDNLALICSECFNEGIISSQ